MDITKFIAAFESSILPAILDKTKTWDGPAYLYKITFYPVYGGGCCLCAKCVDNTELEVFHSKFAVVVAHFDSDGILEGYEVNGLKWALSDDWNDKE